VSSPTQSVALFEIASSTVTSVRAILGSEVVDSMHAISVGSTRFVVLLVPEVSADQTLVEGLSSTGRVVSTSPFDG
jgi:hypothetical protein